MNQIGNSYRWKFAKHRPLPEPFCVTILEMDRWHLRSLPHCGGSMSTEANRWKERAIYDIDTARAMFNSKRYQYVLFCCQQAVEKMLKSIIARRTNALPPRVHQLARLAEVASIDVSEDRAGFLRELSVYYLQSDILKSRNRLSESLRKIWRKRVLAQTEETIQWLQSMP